MDNLVIAGFAGEFLKGQKTVSLIELQKHIKLQDEVGNVVLPLADIKFVMDFMCDRGFLELVVSNDIDTTYQKPLTKQ